MKNSITIKFTKSVIVDGNNTNAIIEIEHGTNARGIKFQEIKMINTANRAIDNIRNDFEDFKVSIEEATKLLELEGYKL